ncbi:hypothetical protein BSKO_03613 [Bryopsis sp. KO-2023]|nr:hypothetical protein BSKO_03613 [Bryopsis sp. KO-2023]
MFGWMRTFWTGPPPPPDPNRRIMSDLPDFVKAKPRPERKGPTWKERLEEESRRMAEALDGADGPTTPKTADAPSGPEEKAKKRKKRKASREPEEEEEAAAVVKKKTGGKRAFPLLRGVFNPRAPLNKSRTSKSTNKKKKVENLGLRHARLSSAALKKGKEDRGIKEGAKGRGSVRKPRQGREDEDDLRGKAGPAVETVIEEVEGELSKLSPKCQELLKNLKKRGGWEVQDNDEVELPPQKKARHSELDRASGWTKDRWEDCIWNPEKVFGKGLVKGIEHPLPKFDMRDKSEHFEAMKPSRPKIDWDWCDEEVVSPPRAPPAPFVPPQTTQPPASDSAPIIPTTITFGSNSDKPAGGSKKETTGGKRDLAATSIPTTAAPSSSFVFGGSDATQATVPMFGNIGSTPVDAQSQPTIGNMFSPAVQRPDRKRIVARRNRSQDSQGGAPLQSGSFGAPAQSGSFGAPAQSGSFGATAQSPANPFGFGSQGIGGAAPAPAAADPNPFSSQQLVFSVPGAPAAPSAPSFGQGGSLNNNSFSGNIPQFGGFGGQNQNSPTPPAFNVASPGFGAAPNAQVTPAFGQAAPAFGGGGGGPGGGGGGFTLGAMDGQKPRTRRRARRTSPHR